MTTTTKPPFRVKRSDPTSPAGSYSIVFDSEEDILWIGRGCTCVGDSCIHVTGEMHHPTPNMAYTISELPDGKRIVSSIALINASWHGLWMSIFAALEWGLTSERPFRLSASIDWFAPIDSLKDILHLNNDGKHPWTNGHE